MQNEPSTTTDYRELAARWLAYSSPYLFWSLVCFVTGSIWLLG